MRLSELQLREKIPTNQVGDTTSRLIAEPGPAPRMGWTLDYEAGMVTASKGDVTMLIPVGNVAYMRPEPKPVKAAKVA